MMDDKERFRGWWKTKEFRVNILMFKVKIWVV